MIAFLFTSDYNFYLCFSLLLLDALQKFPVKVKNLLLKEAGTRKVSFCGSDDKFYKEKKITIIVIAINVLILEQWRVREDLVLKSIPLADDAVIHKYSSPRFSNAVSMSFYIVRCLLAHIFCDQHRLVWSLLLPCIPLSERGPVCSSPVQCYPGGLTMKTVNYHENTTGTGIIGKRRDIQGQLELAFLFKESWG